MIDFIIRCVDGAVTFKQEWNKIKLTQDRVQWWIWCWLYRKSGASTGEKLNKLLTLLLCYFLGGFIRPGTLRTMWEYFRMKRHKFPPEQHIV